MHAAHSRISDLEIRIANYESTIRDLQARLDSKCPYSQTNETASVDSTLGSSAKAIASQGLDAVALAALDAATLSAHQQRSQMVQECEQELQNAVDEFGDLWRALETKSGS